MKRSLQIAIDGPVGAGKSTVAKMVAEKLNLIYIDTGAMYRSVSMEAKKQGVDWDDEEKLAEIAKDLDIKMEAPREKNKDGRNVTVYLDGEDVSWKIRTEEFGEGASVVSQYPEVRKALVEKQRQMAKGNRVVMEGRDIGTVVLPEADLKIYLDADVDERVKRKQVQLEKQGKELLFDEVKQNLMTRDNREMSRKADPLRPAKGAFIFDTTGLSLRQVVDRICSKAVQKN